MLKQLAAVSLLVCVWNAPQAGAQDATPRTRSQIVKFGLDPADVFILFIHDLKLAISKGERKRVAEMVAFPIDVDIGGKSVRLRSAAELVRRFDSVFTPRVVDTVTKQDINSIAFSSQGAMLGNGEVWIANITMHDGGGFRLRIVAVNN